jgi:hypothetical protein
VVAGESLAKRLSPIELEVVNMSGRVDLYEEELAGLPPQLDQY